MCLAENRPVINFSQTDCFMFKGVKEFRKGLMLNYRAKRSYRSWGKNLGVNNYFVVFTLSS